MKELIINELSALDIKISDLQAERLEKYARLLIHWNNLINLTAISEEADIARKHFADSVSVAKSGLISGNEAMIDVGSGAGFPGLPLAIFYENAHFTLLDSTNKRVNFLKLVVEELGLKNVDCICMRAEEAARKKEYRETFDIALSRAVAPLEVLTELSLGFIKKGGKMIAYKGSSANEEANRSKKCIGTCGGKLRGVVSAGLREYEHNFVVIDKVQKTPPQYPRAYASIQKKPIL
jgi:16S rRNA (guanine527-N7)-methyltransferase